MNADPPNAWETLEEEDDVDPADWLRKATSLSNRQFCLSSQEQALSAGFVAARTLLTKLNVERPPELGGLHGTFLAEGEHSANVPIIIDTGASFSLTPFWEDFVSPIEDPDIEHMYGLADSVAVKGSGWVEWKVRDNLGQVALVRTRAYYVPTATVRLLSPQVYFGLQNGGSCTFDSDNMTMNTPDGLELNFEFQKTSNLPFMLLSENTEFVGTPGGARISLSTADALSKIRNALQSQNLNMTP